MPPEGRSSVALADDKVEFKPQTSGLNHDDDGTTVPDSNNTSMTTTASTLSTGTLTTPSTPTQTQTQTQAMTAEDKRKLLKEMHRSSSKMAESVQHLVAGPRSFFDRFWIFIVSFSAFLDVCGTLSFDYLDGHHDDAVAEAIQGFRFRKVNPVDVLDDGLDSTAGGSGGDMDWSQMWRNFVHWLAAYKVEFALLFSLIWFTDAFVKAQAKRDAKLKELDKERLQKHQDGAEIEEKKLSALGTYYWAVFVQLLLLPVSFYLMLAYHLRVPMDEAMASRARGDDHDLQVVFHNKDGSVDELHSFTTSTTQSLFFALVRYTFTVGARVSGVRMKAKLRGLAATMARRLTFFAIRNPRKAAQRFGKIRTGLRWLKYLAPLIATGNKLRGNMMDLIKKYHQRKEAKAARKLRIDLWKKQKSDLDPDVLKTKAATLIQSRFRSRQAQRSVRALQLLLGKKEELAVLRMQRILRTKLQKARKNLMLKKIELQKLTQKQNEMKRTKANLSIEERMRLYKLQDELGTEARELINKKLLLRPNTSFAVTWKVLFVVCVFFEIGQLALAPALEKYINHRTGEQLDIEQVLSYNLVPTPVSRLKQCGYINETEEELYIEKQPPRVVRWLKKARPHKPGFLQRHHDNDNDPSSFPWYCAKPVAAVQWCYVQLIKLLLHEFMVVVGIVCFLDVFVTFFTGELDPENGNLIPKPFFTRWILPGIVLRLLVNPQMETVGRWVFSLMQEIIRIGAFLVYRWIAAFFYPLFVSIVYILEYRVWRPMVKQQNSQVRSGRAGHNQEAQTGNDQWMPSKPATKVTVTTQSNTAAAAGGAAVAKLDTKDSKVKKE